VDIVVRLLPVTSTSLSIVFWGLFEFLYDALGSVARCPASSLGMASSPMAFAELVSVSDVINFGLETVITLTF